MKRLGLMVVLVMTCGLGIAHGKPAASCSGTVFRHPFEVQVCVPKGWFQEVKNSVVKIKDQKEWKVSLRLEPMEGDDIGTALKHVNGKISDLVTGKWGAPEMLQRSDPKNPNRMDGAIMYGQGQRKDTGADVKVLLAVLLAPTNKFMLASVIADQKWMREAANQAEVKALLDSVQPSQ